MTTLDSSQWMYSSGTTGFYSHTIDQSLRFEDGDNPYLSKTLSGSGGTIFTFSCWVKLGNIGINRCLLQGYASSSTFAQIVLYSGNFVGMFSQVSNSYKLYGYTYLALQRDPSAWYNIVVKFNGTSGSEEFKIYINGENQALLYVSSLSAHQSAIGNSNAHYIGNNFNQSLDMDGYMAEVNFIDGTALDADSFGETKAGIWIPKDTSGLTFGTNGFRLKFQDSSALGDDTSGNGNDLSSSGLAATDVVLDSPTNNFATMNPLDGNGPDMREGNLKPFGDTAQAVFEGFKGTFPMSSGKWYWEMNAADVNNLMQVGITSTKATGVGSSTNLSYHTDAMVYNNGGTKAIGTGGFGPSASSKTTSSYGNSYTDGDIIGVALDLDSSTTTLTFYKNNSSEGTAFSSLASDEYVALFTGIESSFGIFNFGQDSSFAGTKTAQGNTDGNGQGDFYYTPPSGYLACCTANLPNPGIDPAEDEEPADYFNTVLYTGDGTTNRNITGYGFDPDFNWLKMRSSADNHVITDRLRGTNHLHTNTTSADSDLSYPALTTDGFTVSGTTYNNSGSTFVSWGWLAGGTAVSNTDGTITSSVSANTEAGFSIVTYTGTGANATVGHGLGVAPKFFITKSRNDSTYGWATYHDAVGAGACLFLNTTGASNAGANIWNNTSPTSSVIHLGSDKFANFNTKTFVCYCFAEVSGYSKVGSYTGNGSTDGAFVYTGFRPAWVIVKRTSAVEDWHIYDNTRSPENVMKKVLFPNLSDAEATYSSGNVDFVSNGFKWRNTGSSYNTSGNTYIYLAFAEQPFKYSNAR